MQLTIKDLKQNSKIIEVSHSDSIQHVMNKVKGVFQYETDCNVKLVYCGQILDKDKYVSDFIKDYTTDRFVVCIKSNPPVQPTSNTQSSQNTQTSQTSQNTQTSQTSQNTQTSQTSQNTQNSQTSQTSQNTQNSQTSQTTYTEEQVRAVLMVFSQFIRVTPDVFYIFCVKPNEFQQFILGQTFTEVMRSLLGSSSQVASAINTQQHINIPIPVLRNTNSSSANQVANSFQNLMNNSSMNNSLINTNPDVVTQTDLQNDYNDQDDQDDQDYYDDQNGNDVISLSNEDLNIFNNFIETFSPANMTAQDNTNIDELVSLGFSKELCEQAYVMSNKDKSVAASLLLDMNI